MRYLLAGIIIIIGLAVVSIGFNKTALSRSDSKLYQSHPIICRIMYVLIGFGVLFIGAISVVNMIQS